MKKIGVISDTHGYLDPRVGEYFSACDEIWHAGDFGPGDMIAPLENQAPLRGVYGNIDGQAIRSRFPEYLHFSVEDVSVLMIHIGGYPGHYSPRVKELMTTIRPKLMVCGHSHILKVVYDEKFQCLTMNPGAAGRSGWHKVRTLLRFTIDGGIMKDLEVIELGPRSAGV